MRIFVLKSSFVGVCGAFGLKSFFFNCESDRDLRDPDFEYKWYIRYEYPDNRVVMVEEEPKGISFVVLAGTSFLALGVALGSILGLRLSASGTAEEISIQGKAVRLAFRALLHGTAWAVGGFGMLVFVSAKLLGASNIKEFNEKMKVCEILEIRIFSYQHF